jgi:hypothetical protein
LGNDTGTFYSLHGLNCRHDTFTSLAFRSLNISDALTPTAEPDLAPPPPPRRRLGFLLPAEYYSIPPGDRRPLVGKGVPWGCGTASIIFLVLIFAGGYGAAHGGLQSLIGWVIDNSEQELEPMLAKDVPPAQHKAFVDEMHRAAANLRSGRAPLEKAGQLLQTIRDASSDHTLSASEVDQILRDVRTINGAAH